MRRRFLIPLLVAAVTATVLTPGGAAEAQGSRMLTVSINCDPATRTVATSAYATGGYVAQTELRIVFRMVAGSHASGTGSGTLPAPAPVTVPVTADAAGAWSAAGYVRPWPAPGDLFYSERVQVSVFNAATGGELAFRDATCYHDNRTTVTFACDASTGTVDVHTSGVQYGQEPSVRVHYYVMKSWTQGAADGPMWIGEPGGNSLPFRSVSVPVMADGTWSDPGSQQLLPNHHYYAAAEYLVVVTNRYNTYALGRGEGLCVWSDQRPA